MMKYRKPETIAHALYIVSSVFQSVVRGTQDFCGGNTGYKAVPQDILLKKHSKMY